MGFGTFIIIERIDMDKSQMDASSCIKSWVWLPYDGAHMTLIKGSIKIYMPFPILKLKIFNAIYTKIDDNRTQIKY